MQLLLIQNIPLLIIFLETFLFEYYDLDSTCSLTDIPSIGILSATLQLMHVLIIHSWHNINTIRLDFDQCHMSFVS